MIDDQALLAAIDEGRENSYGTDEQSSLGAKRAQAIEAYFGLNTNPAPEGRSQVVDRSVYETIATLLPSLVRIFVSSSEDVCKFMPIGPDDEEAAEQTTAVMTHVVTRQNQWKQIFADWCFDALVNINGYTLAYWDKSERVTRDTYEGQSDDQVAALVADGAKIVKHTQEVDKESTQQQMQAWQQAMQQWQMAAQHGPQQGPQGQQMPPPPPPQRPLPVLIHDVEIESAEDEGHVCISVVPPEHVRVSVNTPDWTLKDCPYFEVRQQKTIAQLRRMGLDAPDDISDDEVETTTEGNARDRFGENRDGEAKALMRLVWARMIWVEASDAKDSQLYYVVAVGRTILHKEICNRIPASSMTPQPMPHRHIGMGVAETVKDIQDIKTAVKRGGLDNLYIANSGRYVISSKVNLADFLDSRPGSIVRMHDDALPGEGHVMPLVHPMAFEQIIGSLEYFDQERQNRSGAMRGAAGLEANAMNRAAVGTTVAMQNHSALRTEHIASMLAPAVENLFSIVHELVSKHRNKPLAIQLKGQWVTVDPQAWMTKRDVRISVGVGAGNKDSMMQQLQGVLTAQMQVGLPLGLVTRDNIHATNTEIVKLAGFSNPARFWPDPQRLPPQQPQKSPEQIKAEAEMNKTQFLAQQEQQKFQAQQQQEMQHAEMQARLDLHREQVQAQQKTLEQQMQAEHDARLKGLDHQFQLQMAQGQMAFDKWKAELDVSLKLTLADKSAQAGMEQAEASKRPDEGANEMLQILRQIQEEASQPSEFVRDPQTGRATHVKRGARVREILRGPDGRPTGLH